LPIQASSIAWEGFSVTYQEISQFQRKTKLQNLTCGNL